jgi:hypothetical protein
MDAVELLELTQSVEQVRWFQIRVPSQRLNGDVLS